MCQHCGRYASLPLSSSHFHSFSLSSLSRPYPHLLTLTLSLSTCPSLPYSLFSHTLCRYVVADRQMHMVLLWTCKCTGGSNMLATLQCALRTPQPPCTFELTCARNTNWFAVFGAGCLVLWQQKSSLHAIKWIFKGVSETSTRDSCTNTVIFLRIQCHTLALQPEGWPRPAPWTCHGTLPILGICASPLWPKVVAFVRSLPMLSPPTLAGVKVLSKPLSTPHRHRHQSHPRRRSRRHLP